MSEKLSDQIRRAILDAEISQYRLATEARVDPGHLSRFVNGKGRLGLDAIDRIADVLGLEIRVRHRRKGD
jgi:transcriptional regulator with XRE-family HTH domain